jgi:hypothetical protein
VPQSSNTHKEDSLNPNLDFSQITQTSPRGVGGDHKGLVMSIFMDGTSPSKGERGKAFILVPKKISCWELACKNWNIRYLEISRWSQIVQIRGSSLENHTIQFFRFSEMWSVYGHFVSLISLEFLGFC